jgi:hypothetical protein
MGISHLALGCREWAAMSWLPALSPDLQILLRLGLAVQSRFTCWWGSMPV